MSQNFSIFENGQTFALTGATQTFALTAEAARFSDDVMIYNPGPAAVYVRVGDSGVTATVQSMIILPGSKEVFGKGDEQYLAAMTASGSQNIVVWLGEGV